VASTCQPGWGGTVVVVVVVVLGLVLLLGLCEVPGDDPCVALGLPAAPVGDDEHEASSPPAPSIATTIAAIGAQRPLRAGVGTTELRRARRARPPAGLDDIHTSM
jgi:hypothetical protein